MPTGSRRPPLLGYLKFALIVIRTGMGSSQPPAQSFHNQPLVLPYNIRLDLL
jgi:hypothetical protein